tara:strand:- start:328 stop:603 length:276 start_codon:yes stop_codon:yes gene_type:complete
MEKDLIKMTAIIYTKPLCIYCELTKKLLIERKIIFKELVMGVEITKGEAVEELGTTFSTAPQIVINGIHIGGYTDLVNFFKKRDQSNGKYK